MERENARRPKWQASRAPLAPNRGTKLLSGPTPEGRKKYIWKGLKRFTFLGNKIGWIFKNKNHLKRKVVSVFKKSKLSKFLVMAILCLTGSEFLNGIFHLLWEWGVPGWSFLSIWKNKIPTSIFVWMDLACCPLGAKTDKTVPDFPAVCCANPGGICFPTFPRFRWWIFSGDGEVCPQRFYKTSKNSKKGWTKQNHFELTLQIIRKKGMIEFVKQAFVGVLRGNKGEQNNKTSQFLMLVLFWNAVSWMKKIFSTTTWFGTSDLEIWCIHKDSNVEHLNPWTVRHNTC